MFIDTSSCLKIYDFFYDAQIYIVGKKQIHQTRKQTKGVYITKRSVLEKFDFLEDYYFEEELIGKKEMIEAPEWNKLYSDKGTLIKKEFENI